ncbi:MAG: PhzF family phenazine biosynthesis isomerase [Fuerstiella sp.]
MQVRVHHYDAFSLTPHKGNPAGVVLEADGLSDSTMQAIALKVGFNETAFVLPSDKATRRIRFFTPGHETPLCGHAAVASIVTLFEQRLLSESSLPLSLAIETDAGVLPISIRTGSEGDSGTG